MRQKQIFAYFEQGEELEEHGDLDRAATCYRKAAQAAYGPAARSLADILDDQERYDEAEYWYREAARSGDASAVINVGSLLSTRGEEEEARRWYQVVADSNDILAREACYALGLSYKSQGWQGNAEQWFAKAAALGHKDAQREVDAARAATLRALRHRDSEHRG